MEYTYRCLSLENMKQNEWEGRISMIKTGKTIEAEVSARGSRFYIIAGRHAYGNFICIPGWGIGTEIASFSDRLWNYNHLREKYPSLSKTDATTITDALSEISICYEV